MKLSARLLSFVALPVLALRLSARPKNVGGQAVIEGVMMRGRRKVAWAVRASDGSMVIEKSAFISAREKRRFLRLPVLRGAVNLFESLVLGYKALTRSAEIAGEGAMTEPRQKGKRGDAVASWASLVAALLIGLGLFMYAPMRLLSGMVPADSAMLFNILAGIFRIALFLAYLLLIGLWGDMRRIFEYHGAEHKAIFAFEKGAELTLDNMHPQSTLHPRCGTSFLLMVGLTCILLFSIADALVITLAGPYPHVLVRFLVHLFLTPFVAGVSYEALRLSARHRRIVIVGALVRPGLWLQKITTRNPDDRQLEVAAAALRAVL